MRPVQTRYRPPRRRLGDKLRMHLMDQHQNRQHNRSVTSPDPDQNVKHCYDPGQKSSYGAITAAAESFCRDSISKNKDNGLQFQ
ncbi:hypothetical protein ACHAPI_007892 [Fusarium lateritium]